MTRATVRSVLFPKWGEVCQRPAVCRSPMKLRSVFLNLVVVSFAVAASPSGPTYQTLRDGDVVNGFRATAVYLDEADRPMGGRFVHERTGFTLDLLEIQSVPQTF